MKHFPKHIVAVDGIVENGRNEILLVKCCHKGKIAWTVPGGQVELGENLMDALIREIHEETGANVMVDKLVCVSSNTSSYPGYNGYETVPPKVMFGFTCTYIDGELRGSDETLESRWIPKDNVLDYITVPHLVERLEAYLNFKDGIQYLEYVVRPEYQMKLKRLI